MAKKFVPFMVLKMTGLSWRSQRKYQFWKICIGSWNIGQYLSKFRSPNQTFKFWDILANISGLSTYFTKPIFALKPWAQASHFEYHEAYKRNKKFWWEILHKKLTEYLKTSWSDQIWFIFMSICIVPKHNSSQDIEVSWNGHLGLLTRMWENQHWDNQF